MIVSVVRDDNIKIIEIDGQIDAKTSDEVMAKVTELLNDKPTIISMEKVNYVSSSGLRALFLIAKNANTRNIKMVYAALMPEIKSIMKMTGFLKIMQCADSISEAEEIFKDSN